MILYLLISCVTLVLVSKSFTNKQAWQEGKLKLVSFGLSSFIVSWLFQKSGLLTWLLQPVCFRVKQMVLNCSGLGLVLENVDQEQQGCHVSLLDLPDLAMECILEKLSPSELCNMAHVCSSMRDRCRSDRLWEKHMRLKWGALIKDAAYGEWRLQHKESAKRRHSHCDQNMKKNVLKRLPKLLPFCPKVHNTRASSMPVDSVMSLYLSLERGDFWFPAQVYNRENGMLCFMLSCYDAQLRYDSGLDTFQARYLPYGRRPMEQRIAWDRLRAAPVDTPSHMLHVSDCLHDLKPGDHIEIQWRRSKEFPYGWWYGVIGHYELCEGNKNHCRCHSSDTVVLEFSQYVPGSRWRRMMINRKDHREGNEADGFYGGIIKIYNLQEVAKWKLLWPNQILE